MGKGHSENIWYNLYEKIYINSSNTKLIFFQQSIKNMWETNVLANVWVQPGIDLEEITVSF